MTGKAHSGFVVAVVVVVVESCPFVKKFSKEFTTPIIITDVSELLGNTNNLQYCRRSFKHWKEQTPDNAQKFLIHKARSS